MIKPVFFKNCDELRNWLSENHDKTLELWLGYYKKKSKKFNYSWSDTVDELLCYGWIDGLRKSIDEERYMIRITPRKPSSIWSRVNIEKIEKLIAENRMQPSGMAAWHRKKDSKSQIYAFEQNTIVLDKLFENAFKKNKRAYQFFNELAPSTKRQCIWWVMSAKKEETKLRRLDKLIYHSDKEEKIPQLTWTKKTDKTKKS